MGHQARPMRFVTLETGCMVCLSHQPNQDGYLRKTWGNVRSGDRVAEMFHRFIYRAHKGEIPEGHEVDHLCGIRLCANVEHLDAIPERDHAVKTNRLRYAARKAAAKVLWMKERMTGVALSEITEVSFGQACRWIREWKAA